MVLHRKTGAIQHRVFSDLPRFLAPSDCLVINTTRVLPARFAALRRTGGRIGGLFVREASPGHWTVLLHGAGRLKEGETLTLRERARPDAAAAVAPWSMTLLRHLRRGMCEVRIDPPDPAADVLERIGASPLPPYIRRDDDDAGEWDRLDREHYQTVYAAEPGAIAAPTAGLHFTGELLDRIRAGGTAIAEIVLHVALGTFQPIEVDDLADHPMHSEWYRLPHDTAETIERARAAGGRIVAVGTTSVRVLETCGRGGALTPGSGWTDILIYPPYRFAATDVLLTNFHLPGSTLLALVCAFADRDMIMKAYRSAVDEGYRFYSYGDAMLIL